MAKKGKRDILKRLERIERRMHDHDRGGDDNRDRRGGDGDRRDDHGRGDRDCRDGGDRGGRDGHRGDRGGPGGGHHGDHGHGGGDHDEKRVIDTIVGLVAERVEEMLERYADDGRDDHDGHSHHGDHEDYGERNEKEMIDMVVGLISEHVQEIVAAELDRRLGPPTSGAAAADADEAGSDPPKPRKSNAKRAE